MNLALCNKLSFLEFFFAIVRALSDLSIPVPYEFLNSFNIDNSIQPEPVPISKIFNLNISKWEHSLKTYLISLKP